MALAGLTPAVISATTETAQRFLASSYDSVDAVLETLQVIRRVRREEGQDLRGRLSGPEEDLLRAAVVFAGAGLDASLKQMIRDALADVLDLSADAETKFQSFVEGRLAREDATKHLARYLAARDTREALIEDYVRDLTGSSLQSAEQLGIVAGALGITDRQLRRDMTELRPLFVARNEIAHELDLRDPARHGDRRRRPRAIGATTTLAHSALDVGQRMINAVATRLGGT